jgi:hypothetical protein
MRKIEAPWYFKSRDDAHAFIRETLVMLTSATTYRDASVAQQQLKYALATLEKINEGYQPFWVEYSFESHHNGDEVRMDKIVWAQAPNRVQYDESLRSMSIDSIEVLPFILGGLQV